MRDGQLLESQEIDKMCVLSGKYLIHIYIYVDIVQTPHPYGRYSRPIRRRLSGTCPQQLCLLELTSVMTQATTAWALKKVFPELTLHIVSDAGHSSRESGISKLLVQVCHWFLLSYWLTQSCQGYGIARRALVLLSITAMHSQSTNRHPF